MPLDKNSAYRLRRVALNLEKAQDALHMANGFLYPEPLRIYREDLEKILKLVSKFSERVDRDIPPSKGGRPTLRRPREQVVHDDEPEAVFDLDEAS